MNPRILGVASAVPPHEIDQASARELARVLFADAFRDLERLLPVFDSVQIRTRQLVKPLEWYRSPRSFSEKNEVYLSATLGLATQAATAAMERAGVAPRDVGGLVFVSSTGIAAPSLDSHLIQVLDLPRDVARVPLWGLGCAGGGGGLGRASLLARGLGRPVLLVSAEMCSATFVHTDRSRANLIATALFGDGAAAAVVGVGDRGPEILVEHGQLFDDTENVMGWELVDDGLRVRFARSIPAIVRDRIPGVVDDALARAGLSRADLGHYVLHPGGPKVLHAYDEALSPAPGALRESWDVLRDHGNMSSPTVLFVLERFLAGRKPTSKPGVLMGLGPGFCAEGVVFRW